MDNEKRDLIGDQIGYAVNRSLSIKGPLRGLDRKIIQAIPRPIARIVALTRYKLNLLPEPEFNPSVAYEEFLSNMGQAYLDQFEEKHPHINTIVFNEREQIKTHKSSWNQESKEVVFHWEKQLEWAKNITSGDHQRSTEDLAEAKAILLYQNQIVEFYKNFFKDQFTKRGLPYPSTVSL